ncbi:hypothetical protein ACQCLI_04905 [Pseudomonas nitroreducens]
MGWIKEEAMECYICLGNAEEKPTQGDRKLVECPNCGSYLITGSLISELTASGQHLDEVHTGTWLTDRRSTVAIPMISTADAYKVARTSSS